MKNLNEKIKLLNDANFIPSGLNMPMDMEIIDVRACLYQYWGNKHAESHESFENKAVSIQIKHSKVEDPFWITVFQGATYREEDTKCIVATFEPTIDEDYNIFTSDGVMYDSYCMTKSEDDFDGLYSVSEVLYAFGCKLFYGDESGLYTDEEALFDMDSYILEELANDLICSAFFQLNEKISKENPNEIQLKEINEKLLSVSKGQLYTVSIVIDFECSVYNYLSKDEAEKIFFDKCLEYYNAEGLDQYAADKKCRSASELSIAELEGYFQSEAWHDANDIAKVSIKVM